MNPHHTMIHQLAQDLAYYLKGAKAMLYVLLRYLKYIHEIYRYMIYAKVVENACIIK